MAIEVQAKLECEVCGAKGEGSIVLIVKQMSTLQGEHKYVMVGDMPNGWVVTCYGQVRCSDYNACDARAKGKHDS